MLSDRPVTKERATNCCSVGRQKRDDRAKGADDEEPRTGRAAAARPPWASESARTASAPTAARATPTKRCFPAPSLRPRSLLTPPPPTQTAARHRNRAADRSRSPRRATHGEMSVLSIDVTPVLAQLHPLDASRAPRRPLSGRHELVDRPHRAGLVYDELRRRSCRPHPARASVVICRVLYCPALPLA